MTIYRFLAHDVFLQQWLTFIEEQVDATDAALHHFVQCKEHPFTGKQMHNIPNPALTGKLFRQQIEGPGGFRFVHFHDSTTDMVLPVFITADIRPNFNWAEVPWQDIAGAIVADLLSGNTAAFTEFRLPKP